MSDSNSTRTVSTGGGNGAILIFLFLAFFKLNPSGNFDTPIKDWSWWWVTAPLWIGFVVIVLILLIGGFIILCLEANKDRQRKKRFKKAQAERAEREQRRQASQAISTGKIGTSRFLDKD